MVYTSSDIQHLDLMATLKSRPKQEDMPVKEVKQELSFDEKLLKLCTDLRASGFLKQASSLEQKFLAFKQANNVLTKTADVHLYRAHDEDGEDLIQFAHPKGDVKMADATKDYADVETIVSQHKKIVEVMNKKPTGKLASYVQQCKVVLAQEADEVMRAKSITISALKDAQSLLNTMSVRLDPDVLNSFAEGPSTTIDVFVKQTLGTWINHYKDYLNKKVDIINKETTVSTLTGVKQVFVAIVRIIQSSKMSVNDKNAYGSYFGHYAAQADAAIAYVKGEPEQALQHINTVPTKQLADIFSAYALKIVSEIFPNAIAIKQPGDNLKRAYASVKRQKEEYEAIGAALRSIPGVMQVAKIMDLPQWKGATFTDGENVSSISNLLTMLKNDHQGMSEAIENAISKDREGK